VKQYINEAKRMQQLAGIINEDLESDIKGDLEKVSGRPVIDIDPYVEKAMKSGKAVEITPETKLEVGDALVRMVDEIYATIVGVKGDTYLLKFSFDYEDEKPIRKPRRELEDYWLLYNKK
jgi:hypothetical protein